MQRDKSTKTGTSAGYTTLFRQYDRGSWSSIDPLWREQASESPYSGLGNNPVNMVDPWGEANIWVYDSKTSKGELLSDNTDDKGFMLLQKKILTCSKVILILLKNMEP